MASSKKKFPKLKKKLCAFLSDESGKITKQDVAKLSLGAMLIGGMVAQAEAGHRDSYRCSAVAGVDETVVLHNGEESLSALVYKKYNRTEAHGCKTSDTIQGTIYYNPKAAPFSVQVNGHANSVAKITENIVNGIDFHFKIGATHYAHSSHGAGGWC